MASWQVLESDSSEVLYLWTDPCRMKSIDLPYLLAVFEQDLLFVDSLALSHKGLCLLQGQNRIHLKPFRLRLIANPYDNTIANHVVLQITIITALC